MKRGTVVTVYKCVCCDEGYASRDDALYCSSYNPVLIEGAIYLWRGKPWLLWSNQDQNMLSVRRVESYAKLHGLTRNTYPNSLAIPRIYLCNNKPFVVYTVEKAKEFIKTYEANYRAAFKFYKLITGETDVKPRLNVKTPRLARGNDRTTKRVPKKSVRKPS